VFELVGVGELLEGGGGDEEQSQVRLNKREEQMIMK
jgi:hypothetical protein